MTRHHLLTVVSVSGLRVCEHRYRSGTKDLDNQFCHLTNYSVNRKAQKFIRNEDESADGTGSKW